MQDLQSSLNSVTVDDAYRSDLDKLSEATVSVANTTINATIETTVTVSAGSEEALDAQAQSFASEDTLAAVQEAYQDQGFQEIR